MRNLRLLVAASMALAVWTSAPELSAQTAQPAPAAAPNDYSQDATWLCRPGRADACATDETATAIAPDGKLTIEPFSADPKAAIDCFYVYPTASLDPTPNSGMSASPELRAMVAAQFARFGAVCRTFAPIYRQVTITALKASLAGKPLPADRALAYNDVRDAWRDYLAHDNHGRGVVLIGHSQGAGVLEQLIANEIDGKPAQAKLVSALLLGATVAVPPGADVGGTFKTIAACRKLGQTGCVIVYSSFASPPPADSFFARVMDPKTNAPSASLVALCVNPANLAGGEGDAQSYFSTKPNPFLPVVWPAEWVKGATITTPFVTLPGRIRSRCASDGGFNYLLVRAVGDPADPRPDTIPGSLGPGVANWGLHAVDVDLTIGNLIEVVRAQTKTYLASQ